MGGEDSQGDDVVRQERVRVYQARAREHLPLFDLAPRETAVAGERAAHSAEG
jgi:hypothetical protein